MAAKAVQVRRRKQELLDELKAGPEKLGSGEGGERLACATIGYRVRCGRCRLREDEDHLPQRGLPPQAHVRNSRRRAGATVRWTTSTVTRGTCADRGVATRAEQLG
jgi:hypothetical protein